MNKKILDLLQLQVMEEYQSVMTFAQLGANLELMGFSGYAKWMFNACKEEFEHVHKVSDYLLDRDQQVNIQQTLPHPIAPNNFADIKELAKWYATYQRQVTAQYSRIYDVALTLKDYQTVTLARFFVEDQIHEEKAAQDILDIITNAKDPIIADMRIESLIK